MLPFIAAVAFFTTNQPLEHPFVTSSLAATASSVASDVAPKKLDVKEVGLGFTHPANWRKARSPRGAFTSRAIPFTEPKFEANLDLYLIVSDSSPEDYNTKFAESLKDKAVVERQWILEVLDSKVALTRFTKKEKQGERATIHAIFLRPGAKKLGIEISAPKANDGVLEPKLMEFLETVQPMEAPRVDAQGLPAMNETRIFIEGSKPPTKPFVGPMSAPIVVENRNYTVFLPAQTGVARTAKEDFIAFLSPQKKVVKGSFGDSFMPDFVGVIRRVENEDLEKYSVVQKRGNEPGYYTESGMYIDGIRTRLGKSVEGKDRISAWTVLLDLKREGFVVLYCETEGSQNLKELRSKLYEFARKVRIERKS